MNFPWSREHHRRELLAAPFPDTWRAYLKANVLHYGFLTALERTKLEDDLRLLVAEKHWEGHGGLTITEEIQATVSAQACLLILSRSIDDFAHVESILIYPDAYVTRQQTRRGVVVTETRLPTEGTAAQWGAVVLSWADALAGGRRQTGGRNVVFHEFAHQLDMKDGDADGVPKLADDAQSDEWSQVMTAEYQALTEAVEQGHHTFLDAYGATNAAEFFAVVTEYFFEQPTSLEHHHPRLFAALRGFYQQDPQRFRLEIIL